MPTKSNPGTVNGETARSMVTSSPGRQKPEGVATIGRSKGFGDAQRSANRIATNVATPSPIRTLPSAPESHRIVLVDHHALAGCTAGRDLIVITRDLTQTPKAVLPIV